LNKLKKMAVHMTRGNVSLREAKNSKQLIGLGTEDKVSSGRISFRPYA